MSVEDKVLDDPNSMKALFERLSKKAGEGRDPDGPISIQEAAYRVYDQNDRMRVCLGLQSDGTYGLRTWDTNGTMVLNQTTSA